MATVDSEGRTIWIVDAHRDDGKRFVVHANEKQTAFLELESAAIRPDRLDKSLSNSAHSSRVDSLAQQHF